MFPCPPALGPWLSPGAHGPCMLSLLCLVKFSCRKQSGNFEESGRPRKLLRKLNICHLHGMIGGCGSPVSKAAGLGGQRRPWRRARTEACCPMAVPAPSRPQWLSGQPGPLTTWGGAEGARIGGQVTMDREEGGDRQSQSHVPVGSPDPWVHRATTRMHPLSARERKRENLRAQGGRRGVPRFQTKTFNLIHFNLLKLNLIKFFMVNYI